MQVCLERHKWVFIETGERKSAKTDSNITVASHCLLQPDRLGVVAEIAYLRKANTTKRFLE